MFKYADIDDIEARFRPIVDEDERKRAEALIVDASVMIAFELNRVGKQSNPATFSEDFKMAVKSVVCAMAKRSLVSGISADITQESSSVGGYSQSFTYANPTGDMYIKDSEKRLLGLKQMTIKSISPMTGADRNEV